jgi:enoyl-CoA hydratase/carnithine racemase
MAEERGTRKVSASSPAADLLVEDSGGVRRFTINRPEHAKAITVDMARRLIDALSVAASDGVVRVVMFTGAGERTFCAGADLNEMSAEATVGRPYQPILPDLYAAVLALEKPTLAALNGTAVGGGLELALACDIRIGAAGARVGLPEVRHGMAPTFGTVMLTRVLPTSIALELVFTGDIVPIEEFGRWGAVKVVPAAELAAVAWTIAERIARAAPLAVRKLKAIAARSAHLPASEAMRLRVGPDLYASEDRGEGLRAWRERRPPIWKGR